MEKRFIIITAAGIVIVGGIVFSGFQYRKTNFPKPKDLEITPIQTETKVQESSPTVIPTQVVSQEITLIVSQPTNGATVTSPSLTVRGKTVPRAEVFVNDEELRTNAAGNFSTVVTLDEGENTIVISANDSEGNSIEKELVVTYQVNQ